MNDIKSRYESSQEKYLDMGHLQMLILKNDLTQSNRWMWKELFEYLGKRTAEQVKMYMYFRRRKSDRACWAGRKEGTSIGEYIPGLLENRMDREQKNGVTLRQVYYQWYQNGTLKKLPKITLSEDAEIQVWLE